MTRTDDHNVNKTGAQEQVTEAPENDEVIAPDTNNSEISIYRNDPGSGFACLKASLVNQ